MTSYAYNNETSHLHHGPNVGSDADNGGTCIEACQAVNSVGMCGFHPSNYFTQSHDADEDGDHNSSYNTLYSPSAPVGPTSCEYCGKRNTDHCTSNLPEEYMMFMSNGRLDGGGGGGSSSNNAIKNNHSDNSSNSNEENMGMITCPRPKLFFLKKRPPFSTPDGWNPKTEYRNNLFEPPSSVEGMGRGWGEVRGHVGSNAGGDKAACSSLNTPTLSASGAVGAVGNGNPMNRSYAASGCGSSACGGGGGGGGGMAETEISFSSAGGGNNNERVSNVSGGERSLSPVQWVSGLVNALSPS